MWLLKKWCMWTAKQSWFLKSEQIQGLSSISVSMHTNRCTHTLKSMDQNMSQFKENYFPKYIHHKYHKRHHVYAFEFLPSCLLNKGLSWFVYFEKQSRIKYFPVVRSALKSLKHCFQKRMNKS